jgi:sigma-B regulation protein RsbU (phosphoserine phosphatase)
VPSAGRAENVSSKVLADLLPIIEELGALRDPEELFPAIARELRRLLPRYKVLDIFLPRRDGLLAPAFVEGYGPDEPSRILIRPGEGIVGSAAEGREPIFLPDVDDDPRYIRVHEGVRAELALPLLHRDRLVGVLNVEGPDPAAFTSEAVTALQVLAGHLAVAIENATLFREVRWYANTLATLHDIAREIASILDLDDLLTRVAEEVKRVIDYEIFGILLLDEAAGELVLRKAVPYYKWASKERIPLAEGLTGAAARAKAPILVADVRHDPRYLPVIPEARSELVVPLVYKDRVVGVFDLESREVSRFSEEHVKMLTPLAGMVAVAIENARLYEELFRRDDRLHRELSLARDVQHGLFPEGNPAGEGWEASAHFLPAQELGGDLYDFYDLGDGKLGLAVGDVSGKGVAAALYGAFASGAVRTRAFERRHPADLLDRVNRTLRRRGVEGFFCALQYALFDFPQRRLTVAGSGLPYPLHHRAAEGRTVPLEVAGLPLGALDGSTYEEATVSLQPGDVLVFHSDGVTEANRGEAYYGLPRLQEQVARHARKSAAALGEAILDDVNGFLGEAHLVDDLTLVVVKML